MKKDSKSFGYGDSIIDHRFSSYRIAVNLPRSLIHRSNGHMVDNKMYSHVTAQAKTNSTKAVSCIDCDGHGFLITPIINDCSLEYTNCETMRDKYMKEHATGKLDIEGVPKEFINSFGNFLGMKYFLEGIKEKKDVHTYIDKNITKDDFTLIKTKFAQCRYINMTSAIEYEFYDPEYGYCVIRNESGFYKVVAAIGYDLFSKVMESVGNSIEKIPMASWVTGIDGYGELVIKQFSIKEIHKYNPEFYPFMKGGCIEEYVNKYIESDSSILILIGPPGTAKTNFIRQMLGVSGESVLLTYSEDMKKADKLFSHFYDSPEKFLIIEDADTYIERRQDGNSNMKQLLNITDGLTSNPDKKVIFSTNLQSLSRVDPALLRPGRCFDKLQFDALSGSDLVAAINVIGNEHFPENMDMSKKYTIAELFAIKNDEGIDVVKAAGSFGFC